MIHGSSRTTDAGQARLLDSPPMRPPFGGSPYHYRNAQAVSIRFETDRDAALEVLPEPLELIEPASANLSIYWYPFSTFGPYHEAILRLYARHEGKPLTYVQQIFVDTEPPMLAGREVWGFPEETCDHRLCARPRHDRRFASNVQPACAWPRLLMRPEQPQARTRLERSDNWPAHHSPPLTRATSAARPRRIDRRRHAAHASRSLGRPRFHRLSRITPSSIP